MMFSNVKEDYRILVIFQKGIVLDSNRRHMLYGISVVNAKQRKKNG